jgi:hypothetical protein
MSLLSYIGRIDSIYKLAAFGIAAVVAIVQALIVMRYRFQRTSINRVRGKEAVDMAMILMNRLGFPISPDAIDGTHVVEIVKARLASRERIAQFVLIAAAFLAVLIAALGSAAYVLRDHPVVFERKPQSQPILAWKGEDLPPGLSFHNVGDSKDAGIAVDRQLGRNVFNFAGDGGYLEGEVSGLPYGSSQRTLALWVKYRSMSTNFNEAFLGGYGGFGEYAECYALSTATSGHLMFSTWGPGITSKTEVDSNTWHHVAVTTREDKGEALSTLYLDGVAEAEEHIKVETVKSTKVYIGGLPPAVEAKSFPYISRKLDGEIRNVSLYDTALTPENIKYIYVHEKGL